MTLRCFLHQLSLLCSTLGNSPYLNFNITDVPITAIAATVIAAAATTSEAPHANTFSPWDGNNAPPEVLEAQECLAGPYRRVWAVSAIAAICR